jgi:hypothetical protein
MDRNIGDQNVGRPGSERHIEKIKPERGLIVFIAAAPASIEFCEGPS